MAEFDNLYADYNAQIPRENLTAFVQRHFAKAGEELEKVTPSDFVARYIATAV